MFILLIICQLFKAPTWDYPTKVEPDKKFEEVIDLARRSYYDEALDGLKKYTVNTAPDPAQFLFYKAVCEHELLKKDECIESVYLLLERDGEIPKRYSAIAKLILSDITPLETDSLDEISRIMNNVERRLNHGQAGKVVRGEQQTIIDKLDKIIDQAEQAQQQQAQQSKQSQKGQEQGQAKGSWAEESKNMNDSGPGNVDNKELDGTIRPWGNLPQAERAQSVQRLTESLPSHYRDVIEGYFRSLSKRETNK